MAVIEARDLDSLVAIYQFHKMPNFSIWQGNVPSVSYEGGDMQEGEDKLIEWGSFIQQNGTAAIYQLRIYGNDINNITNKTPFKAAVRFQLNPSVTDGYQQTPDGRVMIIRDANKQGHVGHTNHNPQLQVLIDGQNRLMEMLAKQMENKENDRIGRLIGYLEQKEAAPAKEDSIDRIMKLGELIIDKPDIIDRIGYIFRPDIYTAVQNISGTQKKEEKKPDPEPEPDPERASPAEHGNKPDSEAEALYERMNNALDTIEDITGTTMLVEMLEEIARQDSQKVVKLNADTIKKAMIFL